MIRISLPFIFQLANELEPLRTLPEQQTSYGDVWIQLVSAEAAIGSLVSGSLYAPYLRTSYLAAQTVLNAIKVQTGKEFDLNRSIAPYELWPIKNAYAEYRIALLAELGALNAYFVTQKGGFDTLSLLAFGETMFPPDLAQKVPEAIFDVREAGKCLAYEIPTAAGFHIFRATESVLRKYYTHVTGGKAAPKIRNIGVYLNALKQSGKGDAKILAILKQMTDLYRNPIIHPETVLTAEDAIGVFGLARSAIAVMLAALPVIPPTTALPITSSP